jgi:hypothetical protein
MRSKEDGAKMNLSRVILSLVVAEGGFVTMCYFGVVRVTDAHLLSRVAPVSASKRSRAFKTFYFQAIIAANAKPEMSFADLFCASDVRWTIRYMYRGVIAARPCSEANCL